VPAAVWYQTVFGCSAAGAKRQPQNTITKKYCSAAGEKAECVTRVIYAYRRPGGYGHVVLCAASAVQIGGSAEAAGARIAERRA
jgi:hypothetical protein